MKKLSIGMIVKNEADKLEDTLKALQSLREMVPCELIIADTGSTDETFSIAERYADKVFFLEWQDDFAKARNATLAQATGEWFFFLDADEVLREPKELARFLLMPQSKQYHSILIPIYNITSTSNNSWNVFWSNRIFRRNPGIYFKGKIHEQAILRDPQYTLRQTNLLHSGYNNDDREKMAEKSKRNLETIEKILAEVTSPVEQAKAYLDGTDAYFLYSTEENIEKGNAMAYQAVALIKELPITNKIRKYYLARAYSQLTKKQANRQNWFACRDTSAEYFSVQPDRGSHDMDIYYALCIADYSLGDFAAAKEHGEAYLRCTEQDMVEASRIFVMVSISNKDEIRFLVSHSCKQLGQNEQAWQYAMQIEKEVVLDRNIAKYQFNLAIDHDMPNRLPVFYESSPENQEQLLIELQKAALKSTGEKRLEYQQTLRNLPQNVVVCQTLICCTDNKEECLTLLMNLGEEQISEKLGAVLDQWMRFNLPAEEVLNKLDLTRLNQYLFSCSEQIERAVFACHVTAYYRNQAPQSMDLKLLQAARYILGFNLLQEDLEDNTVIALWELLGQYGGFYAQQLYRPEAWQEEKLYLFNGLDRFIYYSQQAQQAKEKQDYVQYAQLLRQAVAAYPQAKGIVEILVKDVEQKTMPTAKRNHELYQLAEVVKLQIRQMSSQGNLAEAQSLLKQLSEIIPDEPELPSLAMLVEQADIYMQ